MNLPPSIDSFRRIHAGDLLKLLLQALSPLDVAMVAVCAAELHRRQTEQSFTVKIMFDGYYDIRSFEEKTGGSKQ